VIFRDVPDSGREIDWEVDHDGRFLAFRPGVAAIRPLLPDNPPEARRVDDRRVISGIVDVLKSGCRWNDCPRQYGPPTTICNRFNRWRRRGIWGQILAELVGQAEIPQQRSIESTAVRAHRSAHGGKGRRKFRPAADRVVGPRRKYTHCENTRVDRCLRAVCGVQTDVRECCGYLGRPGLLAVMPAPRRLPDDRVYDANSRRAALATIGAEAIIPSTRSRKRPIPHDVQACRARNLIERAFCCLKHCRRIATRYDRLARNFLSAAAGSRHYLAVDLIVSRP